jgi:carboxymethylenebutenolidase
MFIWIGLPLHAIATTARPHTFCRRKLMPTEETITIATSDGACPAYVMTPQGTGPWPAVIFYGDAGGIRPAMLAMARQLAAAGYVVLLHDLYYRFGPYQPLVPREVFAGDVSAILGPLMATTGVEKAAKDTTDFLAYLDTRADIKGRTLGAVGFCLGGRLALAAAATHPDRFAAVASFHGGDLATDAPDSPHWLAPDLTASVYIAAAENDDSYPPAMATRLEQALTKSGVDYRSETYVGAAHGWMVPDFPTYDPAAADRGWATLRAWLKGRLNR